MRRYHKNDNGFTMAEMLITVAIIVILCGFGFVAVIAHQRNLKRMEMDETAQEIFIAAQNHLTAAEANGQWDAFLKKTSGTNSEAARGVELANGPTGYDKTSDKDADSRKFYSFTTESNEAVQKGAASLILPEGSIDETLRGHHFYVEYDAMSGTVYGVFYTDADHDITADDAEKVSRTDPNARRDYKDANGKRTIIGYYGGALGELKNSEDLYAPSVAVRNAESLVLYVVDKNYYRPVSSQKDAKTFKTQLKLTFEGETSKATMEKTVDPDTLGDGDPFSESVLACKSAKKFSVVVPGRSAEEGGTQTTKPVYAEYYAIVLDSIVREDGHFADLFSGSTSGENGGNTQFIPGEDIKITVTLHSDKGGEDVSQTVRVNSLFNSVKTEKNFLGLGVSKTIVTVSNPRHLENLSTEVSGVDFTQIKSGTTIDTVSVVRNLFWDEDAAAEKAAKEQNEKETVTAFLPAIALATGMESPFGYCAEGRSAENTKEKENIRIYPYAAGTEEENAAAEISKGACYGITNAEIQNLEGNNHILAAFRFEGEQNAALINEAADGVQISDLMIADATAAVTGRAVSGSETDSGKTPTAAILIADAKSGSIDNIAVRWYEGSTADGTANPQVDLSQDKNHEIADGLQGCRIFSSEGVASALIGSIDAGAESTSGTFTIQHTTVATVAPSTANEKTASLGVEGETAAILIGQVKSGAVSIDNSSETDETKRSAVAVEGPLSVEADRGTKEKQTAGGLIGSVDAGKVELHQFVFFADSMEISGGAAAGGVIGQIQSGTEQAVSLKDLNLAARSMKVAASEQYAGGLIGADSGKNGTAVENTDLSLNTLDVNGKLAAGGAVGQVSAGSLSLKKTNILTSKAAGDSGEVGQEETEEEDQYGIRVTADNGTAGGLIGSATNQVTELTIQETAVSGSGTADQVEAGSSAGGLIGDTKTSTTTIRSSMASLYIKSEGNGGNSGGSSSIDGAGGLIGSASGYVTVTDSYSGGRTTNADNPEKKAGDAPAMQARYVDRAEGQGKYNVQLVSGSGAAGGLIGRYTGGSLTLTNCYSTSSVAVSKVSGARAGGLIGEAEGTLTANNTYCTGRVYVTPGAGETSSSMKEESTPNYGTYAGKLGGISGQSNYYLKGMKGAPAGAVGTLNGNSQNPSVDEKTLTGADYYDEKCPLKQKVDPAQKSYYFDETIGTTAYPFQTKTVRNARPVCDPDTGVKDQNPEDDASRFAQIGDWEIPSEESSETEFGPYALIYYERIWDPETQSLDPTIYYHGYAIPDGVKGTDGSVKYEEISTKDGKLSNGLSWNEHHLVASKGKYVAEDGYLLLVSNETIKNAGGEDHLALHTRNSEGIDDTPIIESRWYDDQGTLNKIAKQNEIKDLCDDFKDYTAYTLDVINNNDIHRFKPNSKGAFGAGITIWKTDPDNDKWSAEAGFTYIPFFADAVKGADYGKYQNVSKSWAYNSTDNTYVDNDVQAIIRSAEQLQNLAKFGADNNGYLSWSAQSVWIEQKLDITFDDSKVLFYKNGKALTKENNQDRYKSPTIKNINSGNKFSSSPYEQSDDYYVLDGLNNKFVETVQGGSVFDLRITNMNAESVIDSVQQYGGDKTGAYVYNIHVSDSKLKKGMFRNITQSKVRDCDIFHSEMQENAFAETMTDSANIGNCDITDSKIGGNGFAGTIAGSCTIQNCTISNAEIQKNGFAEKIANSTNIANCNITDARIEKNGFAGEIGESNNCKVKNCAISNSTIEENGFAFELKGNENNIINCTIVNAVIGENGFVNQYDGTISGCAIYADPALYKENEIHNYKPYSADSGTYDYVAIGVKENGLKCENSIAGFAKSSSGSGAKIENCSVVGSIYGADDVSGFVEKVTNKQKITNDYANIVIYTEKNASGFTNIIDSGNATIQNCHALGVIRKAQNASGFISTIKNGSVFGNYEAFWSVSANDWQPFYSKHEAHKQLQNNYYLTECSISIQSGEAQFPSYVSGQVDGKTYEELSNKVHIDGLQDQAEKTVGYYRYMPNDRDHQTYPYPMPSGMTAYGDWSHEDPDSYTLLYYEKGDGKYYFHGYTTDDGENYKEVKSSGNGLENGLLAGTDKIAEEDGYILIAGTNSSWSTFGRADNSGNVSSTVNNANTNIFRDVSSNNDLQSALSGLQTLKKKNTDKVYAFQLDKYLSYQDTTKNFASWQTLTQESGGIGISIYSTKGSTPMAKFSFQPFFADTVKKSTSDDKFADTKDSQNGVSYRIRSVDQLQNLIDWDSKRLNVVDPANTFGQKFDHEANRYSYLSTSNDNYTEQLTIQQDLDIDATSLQHGFGGSDGSIQLDGNYIGRKYNDQSVALQNLKCDFAKTVASTGKISSLVIKNAQLDGQASTQAQGNGDIAHGGHKEFVEYNYGTLSDITVQDSTLGSAGLVYQNGDVTKNALKRVRREPSRGKNNDWRNWFAEPNIQGNACRYTITYTYEKNDTLKTGIIENCTVKNSTISGTGMVWRNKGGVIRNSSVEGCHDIGASGFVEYNEATSVQAPASEEDYEYWIDMYQWVSNPEANGYKKVPDDVIFKHNWPTKGNTSSTQISVMVDAVIENCSVKDSEYANNTKGVKGDGFVGVNTIDTQGSTSSTAGKAKAKISNCKVVNVVAAENGFAGENTNGAEISNCAVYADEGKTYTDSSIGNPAKNQSAGFVGKNGASSTIDSCSFTGQIQGQKIGGFAYTNEGTITKSYANISQKWNNTQIQAAGFVYENSGEILHCHALGKFEGSQTRKDGNNNGQAAGFVWNSAAGSKISNSYTAVWSEACMTNYWLFAKTDTTPSETFSECYAMKPESGTFTSNVSGISFVTGTELKTKTPELGNATGAETVTYTKGVEANYGFPVPTTITNYGDWYSDWDQKNRPSSQSGGSGYAVSLTSGSGSFPEDVVAVVRALSADGTDAGDISLNSMEDVESSTSVTENTDGGSTNEIDLTLTPEEGEDGEAAVTLDLSTFTPVRKGWKLLGWLITSPSDLSASEKKTTVSDIVTKINKISDGDADGSTDAVNMDDMTGTGDSENAAEGSGQSRMETSGSSKAVYELETGTKSYHYAPDAVITVTEDMTLSAVWVPDDDTIEKAKDGMLRMDENGNILDEEEQVTDGVTNETTETDSDVSAADTASTVTGDNTNGMTAENQGASTDQTADASGTLPAQNTEDGMPETSDLSDLTSESDSETETSLETTEEEGDSAGEQ